MRRMPAVRSFAAALVPAALVPAALVTGALVAVTLVAAPLGCARRSEPTSSTSPLSQGPHTVTIAGSTIAYNVHGTGPIVFVHPGGPGMEWSYERMRPVEAFATLVYIEPIGTGRSSLEPGPRGFTLDRYAADIESLRARLELPRIILLGHSHGGFVAQIYALRNPGRLNGLILYDTTPTTGPGWQKDVETSMKTFFAKEPWFPEAVKALGEETKATTDSAMTAIFHREFPLYVADWTHRGPEWEAYRSATRLYVAPTRSTDPSASSEVGVAPSIEVVDSLSLITAPTLVIVGKKDFVTPEKYSRMIHDRIQDSRLLVLERSGHMGHIEEPDVFAAGIREFIQSLPH